MALNLTVGTIIKMNYSAGSPDNTATRDPRMQNGGFGIIEAVSASGNFYIINPNDGGVNFRAEAANVADATGQTPPSGKIPHTHDRSAAARDQN